ncbi:MAG: hypothetical protein HKN87_10195 [Saprospiraceae bacterium]|nr:hypothetical protein [Saprospiraceae bacterium]
MKAMTHKLSLALLFTFISFMMGGDEPLPVNHASGNVLMAGVSKINITPGTPIPMSGYGNRNEPFKGVRDSLYASAVVFSDGERTSVLITADLIGFSHQLASETIQQIEEVTGIDQDFILLSATHNHGGPSNRTYTDEAPPEVINYVEALQKSIVAVVRKALEKMQPVLLGAGTGECRMNINRRARFADGSIWLGRNPDGPCDHEVEVVRIDDLNQRPIAIMVNWPCHGTIGGQENYHITGDWPGAAARFVEQSFDHKVIVQVTAGASADINPIYGPNDKFRDIDAIGMLLGEEVERVARSIETFPGGNIEALKMTLNAKGKKRLASRAPNQELNSNDDVEIHLSALKIGNLLFAGVSGELMTEIGMRIKSESPIKHTMIITHCNGNSGYLCTDAAYPEGGYEAMVSRTMPGTEYLISENLKKMIRSLD